MRCREDDGFGVYIYDLFVRKSYRGREIGKSLMERLCQDFPEQPVYVMSDVDNTKNSGTEERDQYLRLIYDESLFVEDIIW